MKQLRLSKSCIGLKEKEAVMTVLDRGYLGMGQEVKAFESGLTEFFGRSAVCTVNGTAALHLALQGIGISKGDEVLVQSLTYVASFQAIAATGATPVACDVDPNTGCIDLSDALSRITPDTKAIMPVHYGGGVGDLESVYVFAKRHGLRVVEDAAHSFGTVYNGTRVGGIGDVVCFSFDGIKNITSGEGGCIVTNDPKVLEKIRNARQLGVEKDSERRFSGSRSWDPNVTAQGWRYHMSDIMAAIGLVQLNDFSYHKSSRQLLAKKYVNILSKEPLIEMFDHDYDHVVPHIFVVKLDKSIDRSRVIKELEEIGIPTGIHYKPNHQLSYFSIQSTNPLINTDQLFPRLLTLPLHPELSSGDIKFVADSLSKALTNK